MILRVPDYYETFHCIADKCKHSCCAANWEIDIDAATYQRYCELNTEFGERLRASIKKDKLTHFKLKRGKCPFLTKGHLCEVYKTLGEKSLCKVCTIYPRVEKKYGELQERILGLSCEEVGRIVFTHPEPINFVEREVAAVMEEGQPKETEIPSIGDQPKESEKLRAWEQPKEKEKSNVGDQPRETAKFRVGDQPEEDEKPSIGNQPKAGEKLRGWEQPKDDEKLIEWGQPKEEDKTNVGGQPKDDENPKAMKCDRHQIEKARDEAIRILQNRNFPLKERFCLFLIFCHEVQRCLAQEQIEQINAVIERFGISDIKQIDEVIEQFDIGNAEEVAEDIKRYGTDDTEEADETAEVINLFKTRESDRRDEITTPLNAGNISISAESIKQYGINVAEAVAETAEQYDIDDTQEASVHSLFMKRMDIMMDMDIVEEDWGEAMNNVMRAFYAESRKESYDEMARSLDAAYPALTYQYEHLMVYFADQYLMGAVNDGDFWGPAQISAISFLTIRDMDITKFLIQGSQFSLNDQIDTVRIFCKQFEHSAQSEHYLKKEVAKESVFSLPALLKQLSGSI